MNAPKELSFRQWAAIHMTDQFIAVTPLSVYVLHVPEDEPHIIFLAPDSVDTILGQAVLETLDRSRFIHPHTNGEFFKWDRIRAADKRWHEDFMRRCRYKTKRDAYKNMLYCLAKRSEGKISIKPHKRDAKPRFWWDLPPEKTVIIPETNDPGIVGAAARLALSHCE